VGDGRTAVEAAVRLHPDLVLLDIAMPRMSGLEALRLIKKELPGTEVVMLTVSDDDADLCDAIELGATGYLPKNLTAEMFFEMLDGLRDRETTTSQQATPCLMTGFADRSRQRRGPAEGLTHREIEVLSLVAEGMSNKAVAQTLSISENTVKYHMKNVLRKLGVQNRTEAVTRAIRAELLNHDSPS
jgi:DNA-binding NarL/FixJ family response regulator